MTGLTYSTYVNSLTNLAPTVAGDANFLTDLPNIIDDAEQRLYRELDLMDTSVRDSSATLALSTRNFTLPSLNGTFIVTQQLNVITPAGTTNPESGTRVALVPTSEESLNMLWPSVAGSTVPQYFAMVSQGVAIVGPWPNAAYTVEVTGTIRPPALSSSVTTTLLSVYFPDLMIAASMVRLSGYMKNYGAAADDPKMAVTWEGHYQALIRSAETEEARKKFFAVAWSSEGPTPLATPPRV